MISSVSSFFFTNCCFYLIYNYKYFLFYVQLNNCIDWILWRYINTNYYYYYSVETRIHDCPTRDTSDAERHAARVCGEGTATDRRAARQAAHIPIGTGESTTLAYETCTAP